MFPILENCVEGLHLKLADGQEWSLVAEESLRSWLQKFGAILGLELRKNSGLPKIIFCPSTLFAHKGSLLAEGPATGVPRTGWKRHKLGAMHLWMHPRVADVVCEIGPEESDDVDVLRMWSSVDVIHTKAVESGALPLHAGLVVQDGSGVLLAGPGGVGKSTCCRRIPLLWRSPCDDEVLVVDAQGEFRCHPFPTWSDYLWGRCRRTWNVQDHFAIKGILFLVQAEKDNIHPVGRGEAAILINDSAKQVIAKHLGGMKRHKSAALKKRVFDNACKLAQKVPAFILSLELNGSFWVGIEKVLNL